MNIDWAEADALCERLTPEHELFARHTISRLTDKGTLWTMAVLDEAGFPYASVASWSSERSKPEVSHQDAQVAGTGWFGGADYLRRGTTARRVRSNGPWPRGPE